MSSGNYAFEKNIFLDSLIRSLKQLCACVGWLLVTIRSMQKISFPLVRYTPAMYSLSHFFPIPFLKQYFTNPLTMVCFVCSPGLPCAALLSQMWMFSKHHFQSIAAKQAVKLSGCITRGARNHLTFSFPPFSWLLNLFSVGRYRNGAAFSFFRVPHRVQLSRTKRFFISRNWIYL